MARPVQRLQQSHEAHRLQQTHKVSSSSTEHSEQRQAHRLQQTHVVAERSLQSKASTSSLPEKWSIDFGGEPQVYRETSYYGAKHWILKGISLKSPLPRDVDVADLMCKIVVEVTIVLNCIQLGACTHPDSSSRLSNVCTGSDIFFIAIFAFEFFFKLNRMKSAYFQNNWNRLDFFLLCVTMCDVGLHLVERGPFNANEDHQPWTELLLKACRLLRTVRILRVIQHKTEVRVVLEGLVAAFQSMFWVAALLGLLIYIASIFCVTFFSSVDTTFEINFKSIPQAMFALFTIAIVADWTDIVTPVTKDHWWSAFFFVGFIICATFGVMNLIIGVITERTSMVQDSYRKYQALQADGERMDNIKEIADIMFRECESHGEEDEPTITKVKMEEFTNSQEYGPIIQDLIQHVQLPVGYDVHDCHRMFDRDATGTITQQEFVEGMGRLIFSNDFQRGCMVQSSIADVLAEVKGMEARMLERMDKMEHNLSEKCSLAAPYEAAKASDAAEGQIPQGEQYPLLHKNFEDSHLRPPREFPSGKTLLERLQEPITALKLNEISSKVVRRVPPIADGRSLNKFSPRPGVWQDRVPSTRDTERPRQPDRVSSTLDTERPRQQDRVSNSSIAKSSPRSPTSPYSLDTEEVIQRVRDMWDAGSAATSPRQQSQQEAVRRLPSVSVGCLLHGVELVTPRSPVPEGRATRHIVAESAKRHTPSCSMSAACSPKSEDLV